MRVCLNLQNCFVALDRMYIKVNVPAVNCPTFRTRKGEIATNVLSFCDTKGDFVYVLASLERSVANSRILRDALARKNRLQLSKGIYNFSSNHAILKFHIECA